MTILTIENIGEILIEMIGCPFCASYPKHAGGYDFGKVYCSNENCKISHICFYPDEWNTRV